MENEEITPDLEEVKQDEENKEVEEKSDETNELKKAQDEAAKWRRIAEKKSKPTETPIIKDEYSLNDEVVDLRLDGYSKDDVNFIMKNGGRKTLEDKNSYVSIAINARKEQAKAEAEANKVIDTSGMSEIERKYTPEMMKAMTTAELAKIVPRA